MDCFVSSASLWLPLFAQADANAQLWGYLPLVAIVVLFYFMMLRPQLQEQKRRNDMLSQLKKNDKVYTSAGIIGVIANISDREVTLKLDDNVRVKFLRRAVEGLYIEGGDPALNSDKDKGAAG